MTGLTEYCRRQMRVASMWRAPEMYDPVVLLAFQIPCSWIHAADVKCPACSPPPADIAPFDNRPMYLMERINVARDLIEEYGSR